MRLLSEELRDNKFSFNSETKSHPARSLVSCMTKATWDISSWDRNKECCWEDSLNLQNNRSTSFPPKHVIQLCGTMSRDTTYHLSPHASDYCRAKIRSGDDNSSNLFSNGLLCTPLEGTEVNLSTLRMHCWLSPSSSPREHFSSHRGYVIYTDCPTRQTSPIKIIVDRTDLWKNPRTVRFRVPKNWRLLTFLSLIN